MRWIMMLLFSIVTVFSAGMGCSSSTQQTKMDREKIVNHAREADQDLDQEIQKQHNSR